MIQKICLAVFALLLSVNTIAQENLNKYKYVLVPKQYEFQRKADSYQINGLHKFLFEKAGFEALFTDESYPADLVENRCIALTSKVISNPTMFKTRFTVELYDCNNKLVYKSAEGFSRIKDYKGAYNQTLRRAMAELVENGHTYVPKTSNSEVVSAKEVELGEKEVAVVEVPKLAPEVKAVEKKELAVKEEVKPKVEKAAKQEKVEKVEKIVVVKEVQKEEKLKKAEKIEKLAKVVATKSQSIEGIYTIDMWGTCKIVKKGAGFAVIGGDEDFEFATISTTSNPVLFMMKKTGFKQVQLLELDTDGNIKIDTSNGFKTYKRVN